MHRFFLMLAVLAVAACSEPCVQDFYINSKGKLYEFDIPFQQDSSICYDLEFYAGGPVAQSLQLQVTWTSPEPLDTLRNEPASFTETVYLPSVPKKGLRVSYREGLTVPAPGEWLLSVYIPNQPSDFAGLGLIVTKKYGTRKTEEI